MTESDIGMAEKFNAIIYAFNTNAPPDVKKSAEQSNVSIRQITSLASQKINLYFVNKHSNVLHKTS